MKTLIRNNEILLRNFVCAVALLASVYAILHGSADSDTKKWAFGTVGLILRQSIGRTRYLGIMTKTVGTLEPREFQPQVHSSLRLI